MTKHAVLSASASARWLRCPGSIAMSQGIKDNAGESARWGTAAHELASWGLDTGLDAEAFKGRTIEVEGSTYTVDAKMIDCVQVYLDLVNGLVEATGGQLLVEVQVDYTSVLDAWVQDTDEHRELVFDDEGNPVMVPLRSFGTADAIILAGDEIFIIDLKTGQRDVDPSSPQLKMYALGALDEFGLVSDFKTVRLIISQPPKSAKPKEAVMSVEALQGFAEWARKAGQSAASLLHLDKNLIPLDQLHAGSHCHDYYCKARSICPKLRQQVSDAVFQDLDALEQENVASACSTRPSVPDEPSLLAALYPHLDMIEGWCKEIRATTYEQALEGVDLPGLKLVAGKRGSRAWTDKEAAEAALKSMRLKLDEMYKQELQSPTQIEKVLKDSPRKWNKVKALIEQPEGKPSLVLADDKREALVIAVANDFEALPDEVEGTDDLV